MDPSYGVHADELSRRICELELAPLRRPSIAESENGPHSNTEERSHLRPDQESHNKHTEADVGVTTPPEVPAPPPSPHHEPSTSDGALADIDTNTDAPGGEQPKKKKRKKKSSGKNKKPAPTGFEEFYADAPITPREHEEESDIYATSRPFHERIQSCIQRYRKRRNLDSTRANILTKYLMLGGVEASTTKQFTGGLDKETLDNSTAQEIAEMQATDFIRPGQNNSKYFDPSNPENWVVDFEGVAKGFFSSTSRKHLHYCTEKQIKVICGVVRNFLNYVLLHAVCPEYTEDVMAARRICDLAEKELWDIEQAHRKFDGLFNTAASILYIGHFEQVVEGDSAFEFEVDSGNEDSAPRSERRPLNISAAERIFKTAVAFEGTEESFLAAMNADIHVVKSEMRFVEVVQINRATTASIDVYSRVKDRLGVTGTMRALGRIHFKAWSGHGYYVEDTTDDEGEDEEHLTPPPDPIVETFWLDDHILRHCFVGMKLEIDVRELNIGIKFMVDVHGIFCSFYTLLPNEKVIDSWTEPIPNTRPPPTEDDPDVEENTMGADMGSELAEDEKQSEKQAPPR